MVYSVQNFKNIFSSASLNCHKLSVGVNGSDEQCSYENDPNSNDARLIELTRKFN